MLMLLHSALALAISYWLLLAISYTSNNDYMALLSIMPSRMANGESESESE
jgi:hypothetical protein